jgi:UDP-galactopyranose mutase
VFDYLVVGAGLAGSVVAQQLASFGASVLIIDQRPHIAGTVYDEYDDAGILVQRYGAHIFHSNAAKIFDYLSQFTDWRPYEHRVLSSVEGQLLPFPINLDTVNRLYGTDMTSDDLHTWFQQQREPRDRIVTATDAVVSKIGRDLFERFYENYTVKQWDRHPDTLGAQVTNRIPFRWSRDDRYFTDDYQGIPKLGYTKMVAKMLAHPNISIMLQTPFQFLDKSIEWGALVWTGPIDEYFDYKYGRLPYRSIDFHFETVDREYVQPVGTINYPNTHTFIRSTEFKHLTGQHHPKTTIVYEVPTDDGEPLYPVPCESSALLYEQYAELAKLEKGVWFIGRLGTYRYYNMDQVIAQALKLAEALVVIPRRWQTTTAPVLDRMSDPQPHVRR